MNVLVVDDDSSLRESVRLALEFEGHDVSTAESGRRALALMGERPPELVLLDLNLGEESGLEVLEAVQRRHPGTPVAIVTADATPQLAEEVKRAGAAHFLEKPFSLSGLRALVARVKPAGS